MSEKILRRLVIRAFHVNDVVLSDTTAFFKNKLSLNTDILDEIKSKESLIANLNLSIIKPNDYNREINTIMDIIPISTKVLGSLGEGITHTLTGAYVMLTGVDEDGRQMHEFGSSDGNLSEKMIFGRCGTPAKTDFIIHLDVTVQGGLPYERKLPLAAFRACDTLIQTIRTLLKECQSKDASETHEFFDKIRTGGKKVVLIKQVAGQGAMYDNHLFANEPSGVQGGVSIIDIGNVPIILSPNEYRDGALRAMT